MINVNEDIAQLKAEIILRDRQIADLQMANNKLSGDNAAKDKAIRKKDGELERMMDFIQLRSQRPAGYHPELILLTTAILCVVRLVWFIQVENWGRQAKQEAVTVNEVFLILTGTLLVLWSVHDARVNGWVCIAKAALLVLAVRVAIQNWMWGFAPQATLTVVVMLVFLAMPFSSVWVQKAVMFLMNPRFRR